MLQPLNSGEIDIALSNRSPKSVKLSLQNSFLFPDQFIFLYNSTTTEMIFEKGCKEFFDHNVKLMSIYSLFDLIHPDERAKIKSVYNKLFRFWREDISKPYEQVFSITYRIKKLRDEFRNICCQTMIAERCRNGITSLNMISDISQFFTGANVLWTLKGPGSQRFYEKNKLDLEENNLTDRELEIIKCVARGMNSKETANHLKISLYTVYTHRRNMLTKMKFENMLQVVNFALKKGIISV